MGGSQRLLDRHTCAMKRQRHWQRERIVRHNIALRRRACHQRPRCRKARCDHTPRRVRNIRLSTPEHFTLGDAAARLALFKLVHALREGLAQGHRVHLDFTQSKRLHPCGTLYFTANLDQALTDYPGQITCNYPEDNTVEQLFQHIGLLQWMGLSPRQAITAENVRHWHFVKGKTGDAAGFAELMAEYTNSFDGQVRMGLYSSLTEAVTNTIQHAYPDIPATEVAPRPWWMFAQRLDDLLTVTICDLGIGIAESLKRKPELKDYLLHWRPKTRDKKLIEAAAGRRSSTKLPYRGRGLPEMLEFVRTSRIGGMIIHSNRGTYSYDVDTQTERTVVMAPALPGTLIQWTLSIAEPERT